MAKGIDSYAHTACLNAGGYTIAILGNGLDICYPGEHHKLMKCTEEKSLLLSEYPPGTPPSRYTFPRRNRLIRMLGPQGSDRASSKGYIVRWVEAPSNKLLTTAFEASLESVAVTLQAKRRQQDNRDSY